MICNACIHRRLTAMRRYVGRLRKVRKISLINNRQIEIRDSAIRIEL